MFWVFLTNVLVLNMLIAMMNATFEKQSKEVHSVWLLDVSYRVMRYEKKIPELIRRLQTSVKGNSFNSLDYWKCFFWNVCLTAVLKSTSGVSRTTFTVKFKKSRPHTAARIIHRSRSKKEIVQSHGPTQNAKKNPKQLRLSIQQESFGKNFNQIRNAESN